ncbi:hypothetical protein OJF2_14720 [Aquisphaera giovannonii]|uniref:Uncharacterized protein n=1 Tax=Aquisphaera giovannonii TaxID=406548 RepID=A0A5B9VZ81_9BACT|nr:hypothetical protein [Aquisphaera giovannonii]QEH32980.1 hypothetical protein OJF2_14720 [Aquisphaera giovannonii]
MAEHTDRRRFMSSAVLGAVGAGAMLSLEEKSLQAARDDGGRGRERHAPYRGESLPCGQVGELTISRLLLGGNLFGGWAHSRDLLYVSRLLREYNTDDRILDTLELAEHSGVNMIQVDPSCVEHIVRYRRERGGKMQMLVCLNVDPLDPAQVRGQVKQLVDLGVEALYGHGERTDHLTMNNQVDVIGRTIDLIKMAGVPAGVGSHSLQTPIACEKGGIANDFYVKTFHPDNYWSATPAERREEWCWYAGSSNDHERYHDNIFDLHPDRTEAFMKGVKKPWFAFKVMAAGAIPAQVGISHAFQHGADFVVAGMFDFQLAADVEIAVKALKRSRNRERPWFA